MSILQTEMAKMKMNESMHGLQMSAYLTKTAQMDQEQFQRLQKDQNATLIKVENLVTQMDSID